MTQYAKHVDHQLPNELARVNFLLHAIECKDTGLNSAIAMVTGDKRPTWNMNKYEYASAYLNPWDPVVKNFNTNRKIVAA